MANEVGYSIWQPSIFFKNFISSIGLFSWSLKFTNRDRLVATFKNPKKFQAFNLKAELLKCN